MKPPTDELVESAVELLRLARRADERQRKELGEQVLVLFGRIESAHGRGVVLHHLRRADLDEDVQKRAEALHHKLAESGPMSSRFGFTGHADELLSRATAVAAESEKRVDSVALLVGALGLGSKSGPGDTTRILVDAVQSETGSDPIEALAHDYGFFPEQPGGAAGRPYPSAELTSVSEQYPHSTIIRSRRSSQPASAAQSLATTQPSSTPTWAATMQLPAASA